MIAADESLVLLVELSILGSRPLWLSYGSKAYAMTTVGMSTRVL